MENYENSFCDTLISVLKSTCKCNKWTSINNMQNSSEHYTNGRLGSQMFIDLFYFLPLNSMRKEMMVRSRELL